MSENIEYIENDDESYEPSARQVRNTGDLGVFGFYDHSQLGKIPSRSDLQDSPAHTRTVLGGDIELKSDPSADFQFFWHLDNGSEFAQEEYDTLRDKGYREVDAGPNGKFIARRWRVDASGHVRSGSKVLMARPRSVWADEQASKEVDAIAASNKVWDAVHEAAEELGLGTFETRRGATREVVRSKN